MMVSQTFLAVLLASSLACVVTTIGIYVISKYEAWGRKNTTYFMSFAAGVLVSVEGIVTFLLLERRGFGKKKSALHAFLAAAVSTLLGTLVSYPFVDRIARPTLGLLLAVSAGALVYVGASHLLPEVEKENRRYGVIALSVGVLVAVW